MSQHSQQEQLRDWIADAVLEIRRLAKLLGSGTVTSPARRLARHIYERLIAIHPRVDLWLGMSVTHKKIGEKDRKPHEIEVYDPKTGDTKIIDQPRMIEVFNPKTGGTKIIGEDKIQITKRIDPWEGVSDFDSELMNYCEHGVTLAKSVISRKDHVELSEAEALANLADDLEVCARLMGSQDHKNELPVANTKQSGDQTNIDRQADNSIAVSTQGDPLSTLEDPVTCRWVGEQVGKAAGRSDHLAKKMRRKGYPVITAARKSYCQRKDAIAMFPKLRKRLAAREEF